ncbi:MAG: sigma-70 family RNA polymerase sigma factor [Acidobacteria bacterium]|nr:sigma-70 family RNA polymerase sigma factor [Acidobacteriota bacterium]
MAISAEIYNANHQFLWGLCYRMTGNAADADEIVQETFVKALEKPPQRMEEPLRPWLVRVALNLSRDLLRRRKRRGYVGEWLPTPVPTDSLADPPSYDPPTSENASPAARYEMLESISFAFLLALEALSPTARAVLLLRDVFDYTTNETAEALGISETSAKVILHRARKALSAYEKKRPGKTANLTAMTRQALERFLYCLDQRDIAGLEQLLTEDVVSVSDGGGDVYAAIKPIYGRRKVMRLIFGLAKKIPGVLSFAFTTLNGLPALIAENDCKIAGIAERFTIHCEVNEAGRIQKLDIVLAPKKLTAAR